MKYSARENNLIASRRVISNLAKDSSLAPVPELVRRELARSIGEELSHKKMETIPGEFVTEYRMELYVFTKDEFYRAVKEEARELMNWFERRPLGKISAQENTK